MMHSQKSLALRMMQLSIMVVVVALAIRLISLGLYPLMDTTEARYGEIARIMAETGNWITPQFDYNVPFWGKPPLHTWLSAISFKLFGVSEFSARFPHFLTGMLVLALVWKLAADQGDRIRAAMALAVLATTVVFSISIGAVMTDTVLLAGTTLTLVSFWQSWFRPGAAIWGYLFFVGLAIGLLAKGPITFILTGIPVFLWCLPEQRLLTIWSRLPWIKGTCLMLAITVPWYVLAERASPGFLDYFIVGEHFRRFLVGGWEGDLYGSAHIQPKGMIWLLWLGAALPWNIVLPLAWWKSRQMTDSHTSQCTEAANQTRQWRLFLWCWMLSPMLFFTMASNILWTYVLPGIPALALLIADYLGDMVNKMSAAGRTVGNPRKLRYWLALPGSLVPLLILVICITIKDHKNSAAGILDVYRQQPDFSFSALYFWPKRPFSGQFYSSGKAIEIRDEEALLAILDKAVTEPSSQPIYLALKPKDYRRLPPGVQQQLRLIVEGRERSLWTTNAIQPVNGAREKKQRKKGHP